MTNGCGIMEKVICGNRIEFFDNKEEIMYIDYSTDECVWHFSNSNQIIISEDMELFEPLKKIMLQNYIFIDNEVLKSYKNDNKLVWYSDCYYNPDDKWSVNSISYLNIIYEDNMIKLNCIKPLDEMMTRKSKSHFIIFSPNGNGKNAINVESRMTLQDDFVINVYQELLKNDKVKNKSLMVDKNLYF